MAVLVHTVKRKGFALLTTLWLIVAIAAVALEFSLQTKERRLVAMNIAERGQALAASNAGIETTRARVARLLNSAANGQTGSQGTIDMMDPLYYADSLFTDSIDLGSQIGGYTMIVRDAGSMLGLANLSERQLRELFIAAGADYAAAEKIAQSVLDWTDFDSDPRAQGAERDAYVQAGMLVLPTNSMLKSVSELRDVMGMTPDLYARVADYLMPLSRTNTLNVNKAPEVLLRTLPGFTPDVVNAVLTQRYSGVPIRSIQDLQRLAPGLRTDLAEPGEVPLSGLVTFTTQSIVVRSTGWGPNKQAKVTYEALLTSQQTPGQQQQSINVMQRWAR